MMETNDIAPMSTKGGDYAQRENESTTTVAVVHSKFTATNSLNKSEQFNLKSFCSEKKINKENVYKTYR